MKAILCKQYGAPSVLHVGEVPKPAPKPNEILIRVRAAEATKADCEMRAFKFVYANTTFCSFKAPPFKH